MTDLISELIALNESISDLSVSNILQIPVISLNQSIERIF